MGIIRFVLGFRLFGGVLLFVLFSLLALLLLSNLLRLWLCVIRGRNSNLALDTLVIGDILAPYLLVLCPAFSQKHGDVTAEPGKLLLGRLVVLPAGQILTQDDIGLLDCLADVEEGKTPPHEMGLDVGEQLGMLGSDGVGVGLD